MRWCNHCFQELSSLAGSRNQRTGLDRKASTQPGLQRANKKVCGSSFYLPRLNVGGGLAFHDLVPVVYRQCRQDLLETGGPADLNACNFCVLSQTKMDARS